MFELVGVVLPVAAVEVPDLDLPDRGGVETARIHADAVGIGARNVKAFDAALRAEMVLCDAGVEAVGGQGLLPLKEADAAVPLVQGSPRIFAVDPEQGVPEIELHLLVGVHVDPE
jgi:hypothetical protein